MNEQDVKQVKDIVGDTATELVELLRPDLFPEFKRWLADRGDRFAGVKYIASCTTGEYYRVTTRDVWIAHHGHEPPPLATLFFEWSDGDPVFASNSENYTSWHPKTGDWVRLDSRPEQEGQVQSLCISGGTTVRWKGDTCDVYYNEHALRPYVFGPPEKPKPKFEDNTLVVSQEGYIRVARIKNGFNFYEYLLGGPAGATKGSYHKATFGEVREYVDKHPSSTAHFVCHHFKLKND